MNLVNKFKTFQKSNQSIGPNNQVNRSNELH